MKKYVVDKTAHTLSFKPIGLNIFSVFPNGDFKLNRLLKESVSNCMGYCLFTKIMLSLYFSDPSASADLAVVLMQEGLAHVFLVGKRYAGGHVI